LPADRFATIGLAVAALVVIALTLLWHLSPAATLTDPAVMRETLREIVGSPWAPLAVLALFLAAGLVAFPVVIMIAATAAAFGPWLGFTYALAGVLASALLTYAIGARFGQAALFRLIGPRLERIRQRILQRGVFAVAAIRLVPIAPFTIVNLVAGASAIRLADFMLGTLLGMLPGLVALSALGYQIVRIITHPTATEAALLALAVAGWIAVTLGVQALVGKFGRRTP
jgi:phospholipase D1/2